MAEKKTTTIFETLAAINVNEHVEKKTNGSKELTYLSWAWAVDQISRIYPNWDYKILEFDFDGIPTEHGLPYQKILGGYQVQTEVTIEGKTRRMWLPIMDSHNAAMKDEPYRVKTKYGEYVVPAVDAMAINKTIMRCLVKNLGMFGLGLYIYAGEDIPNAEEEAKLTVVAEETANVKVDEKTGEVMVYPVKGENIGMSETEVFTHKIINPGKLDRLKDKLLLELITDITSEEQEKENLAILNSFATKGEGKDKEASLVLLNMIKNGTVKVPEYKK